MYSTHPSKSQTSNTPSAVPIPGTGTPTPVWNKNPDPDWDRAASQEEALHLYETFHEFELPGDSQ
jgi:hypothetical protein